MQSLNLARESVGHLMESKITVGSSVNHESKITHGSSTCASSKSLSEKPRYAGDDGGASQMDHGFIVGSFFFPANQQATKTIEPRVRAFDDPALGFGSWMTPLGFNFLAASAQMQG